MNIWTFVNLLDLIPTPCAGCDSLQSRRYLCKACEADLPYLQQGCERCGFPHPDAAHNRLCGRCQHSPPAFERSFCLFHYAKPVDHWLQQLKFQKNLVYAALLADLFKRRFLDDLKAEALDCILPVPLHAQRLRQRGFNQALELARPLAHALKLPLSRYDCVRTQATLEQSSLPSRLRAKNVRNAFSWRAGTIPERILVVDDVMTTGHTLNSLCRTLIKAGAKKISVAVIGRA